MHSSKRYRFRLPYLVAVGLFAVLSACTGSDEQSGEGSVSEQNGPAGQVPDGLSAYYGQSLDWEDCEPYATSSTAQQAFTADNLQCARLTVPLDYDKPHGETVELGLLRHRATGDSAERIGSLLVNPGGPGASGMESAASLLDPIKDTALEKRFDLVGFDPRGVGASEPVVRCLTDDERDEERADDVETDGSAKGVAEQEDNAREFAKKCAKRTKYGKRMLANLGSRDVARDMDVMRSALGDKELSYVGFSYGTKLGYTYAEEFPHSVRAMVLDGAVDPEQGPIDSEIEQGKGFGTAFKRFADWCADQDSCPLGSDPDKASERYQHLVRPLIKDSIDVNGRELSYQNATMGTIQALYSRKLWKPLLRGLRELDEGQGQTLLAMADLYYDRGPDGEYARTQDAFQAIHCVDEPTVTDKKKIEQANEDYDGAAPFLDDGRQDGAALDTCAYWPVSPTSKPHEPDVDDVPPALVISTTNDPATPHQAGVDLAKAMHGRLLSYEGTQHTVFLQGESCVDKAGIAYLTDGALPDKGKTCS